MDRRHLLPPVVRLAIVALAAAPFLTPALLGAPAPRGQAPASDARLARAIDAYVKPLLDRGHLSGQLLVARNGSIVVERCFGFANQELRVPVTAESRFCIASVTKPMTVLLTFRLIEQGKLRYRDSIARWLPDFPRADRITIEHLLRHRSGIRHEIVPDSLATRPRSAAEMVELAKQLPFDFDPGAKTSYSSGGFTVLARILELASGKDYQSLLDEHLFRPLGMSHSSHVDAIAMLPGRVAGYVPGPHGIENAPLADFSGLVGAGSVWSTARDLHLFVQGVVSGRLGETTRQSFVRGGKLDFGGRTGGFRAYATWDSATGLEVIFTSNVITGAPELLRDAVPRLAAGESLQPPALPALRETPLAEAQLRRYEGDFQLETGVRLTLRVRDGNLWANDWLMLPTADGGFFSPRDYGLIRGVEGAGGRIERLDWTQGERTYPAPRVGSAP
jgi:CubicO group peptidase (beta-lactamase class C family)